MSLDTENCQLEVNFPTLLMALILKSRCLYRFASSFESLPSEDSFSSLLEFRFRRRVLSDSLEARFGLSFTTVLNLFEMQSLDEIWSTTVF